MRRAHVYQLRDRVIVHPLCKTAAGLWVAAEPYVYVPLEAQATELGEVVLGAIAKSQGIVEHPSNWSEASKPRLAAAGVASEAAFQRNSKLVEIQVTESGLSVEPTHNGGAKGPSRGFTPLPGTARALPSSAKAHEVGIEIYAALGECTT